MARSCYSCKASKYHHGTHICQLGYPVVCILGRRPSPAEDCPKPVTVGELRQVLAERVPASIGGVNIG